MPCRAELVCVDPARVCELWPHARALLQRATARTGFSSFCDIERDILGGCSLLWLAVLRAEGAVAIAAAGTTRLERTDGGLACVIAACGGSGMAEWLPLLSEMEAYARAEGCNVIRIIGRRGWMRVLPGYRQAAVVLERRLGNSEMRRKPTPASAAADGCD